jgi:hypothetical protein
MHQASESMLGQPAACAAGSAPHSIGAGYRWLRCCSTEAGVEGSDPWCASRSYHTGCRAGGRPGCCRSTRQRGWRPLQPAPGGVRAAASHRPAARSRAAGLAVCRRPGISQRCGRACGAPHPRPAPPPPPAQRLRQRQPQPRRPQLSRGQRGGSRPAAVRAGRRRSPGAGRAAAVPHRPRAPDRDQGEEPAGAAALQASGGLRLAARPGPAELLMMFSS